MAEQPSRPNWPGRFAAYPFVAPYAEEIALGIVVILITYFSLVLGELVPKRLGLSRPESIAMTLAQADELARQFRRAAGEFSQRLDRCAPARCSDLDRPRT